MTGKITARVFWTIWTIASLILVGTISNLEITSGLILKGIIYIVILGMTQLLTRNLYWIFGISTVLFVAFLTFKFYTDWRGEWKTQTIMFQNKHLSNRTIEFQLQDIGSLGYNRRKVDRLKIIPFVSWTRRLTEKEVENIDTLNWDRIDIDKNEQGLKGG
ncbi:MAG: hypothetical protein HYZ44_00710 [Bacteroidetes bacterium]|nr:hypothetical protein [Bacteroidota bacterium]